MKKSLFDPNLLAQNRSDGKDSKFAEGVENRRRHRSAAGVAGRLAGRRRVRRRGSPTGRGASDLARDLSRRPIQW